MRAVIDLVVPAEGSKSEIFEYVSVLPHVPSSSILISFLTGGWKSTSVGLYEDWTRVD